MASVLGLGPDKGVQRRQLALQQRQLKKAEEPQGAEPGSTIDPIAEAARRARLAALNRKGRSATILSGAGSPSLAPAYSNTVLGA